MIKLFSRTKTETPINSEKEVKVTITQKLTMRARGIIERKKQIKKTSLRGGLTRTSKLNKDEILNVIRKPRITEKAAVMSERGVYVFNIQEKATKDSVKQAVQYLYKVSPVKVCIARTHTKPKAVKGQRRVVQAGGVKKAYVYLKKGEVIKLT